MLSGDFLGAGREEMTLDLCARTADSIAPPVLLAPKRIP